MSGCDPAAALGHVLNRGRKGVKCPVDDLLGEQMCIIQKPYISSRQFQGISERAVNSGPMQLYGVGAYAAISRPKGVMKRPYLPCSGARTQ